MYEEKLSKSTFNKYFCKKHNLQYISGKPTEFHYNCLNFTKVLNN